MKTTTTEPAAAAEAKPAERRRAPRPRMSRRQVLKALASGPPIILVATWGADLLAGGDKGGNGDGKASAEGVPSNDDYDWNKHHWGYAIDISKCIGCGACMRACRKENDVPKGCHRTWVERYRISEKGKVSVDVASEGDHVFEPREGDAKLAFFVPKLCNHCEKSVCSQVCPVGASYHTKDGVVLVDTKRCVGCGYCVQACPYGCRFINPHGHTADKCTLCYHRITRGMLPACAEACPRGARIFGDLNDPKSKISTLLKQQSHRVLRPELGTHPQCYYFDLHSEVI